MKCATMSIVTGILATLGVALVGAGIYVAVRETNASNDVKDLMTVCPSDEADNTDDWKTFLNDVESTNDGAKYTIFHMFHVFNPADVMKGDGIKLREVGPYAFREYTTRSHTSFGTDGPNDVASVKTIEQYTSSFDAAESERLNCVGPTGEPCDFEKDVVTSFNPLLLGGAALTGQDQLLPIALTPAMLATSTGLSSDGGDMCDFLFEHQEADTLSTVVDELATKKFWENVGWNADQQAAAVAMLKNAQVQNIPGVGLGPASQNEWLLQERPTGLDAGYFDSTSPANGWFGGETAAGVPYGHLMQSQCTCRMIKDQAADPAPMLGFLSAALAAAGAAEAAALAPTAENNATAEAAAAEAEVQQGIVFDELTKMILMAGDDATSNTCGGYSNIFVPFATKHGAVDQEHQALNNGEPLCEELISVDCITKVGQKLYERTSAAAAAAAGTPPAWVADCDAKVGTAEFPTVCYAHAATYTGAGSDPTDASFLKQMSSLMYIVTPDYIGTMLYYFQRLSALGNAISLVPGQVTDPASGLPNDGPLISRTMQEWSHGYTGALTPLTGVPFDGYLARDHETGTPAKEPRQYLTGCDDVKHVNVRDQRGPACTQANAAAELTDDEAATCFEGLFTHYAEFAAQGYDPLGDGLGMRIDGYDGASAPPVDVKTWREKLAGKIDHLRNESLPVFVSQAYQDLSLVRNDSSFMVDSIETTKYSLDPSTLSSSDEASKRFIGLQFDAVGGSTNVDGLMDRKMLDGVSPHIALSQPYFINGAASLVADILIWDSEAKDYIQLKSATTAERPEYDTWIAIEHLSGATIAAHKRLQANFIIDQGLLTYTCPNCPVGAAMPVYWIDETGALTATQSTTLSSFLRLVQKLPLFMGILIGIGALFAVVAIVLCIRIKKNKGLEA